MNSGSGFGLTTFSGAWAASGLQNITVGGTTPTTVGVNPIILGANNLQITSTATALPSTVVGNTPGLLTVSSPIEGSGSVTVSAGGTGAVTLSGVQNYLGSFTNNGTGNNLVTLGGVVGANVTSIIQNSVGSRLLLSGANTAFSGGVTVTSGVLQLGSATAVGFAAQ